MTNQRSGREPGTWEFWKIDGPHGYNTLRYVYARWNWPHGLAYFFNVFVAIIVYLLFLGLSLALFWHRIAPIVGYMFVSGICVRCLDSLLYSDKFGVEVCAWRKIPLVDCCIVITNVYYDMYLCFLESLEDCFLMR